MTQIRDALEWALAEINGETKYENDQHRQNCLDRAEAALRRPAPTVEEVRDAIHAWIREDAGLNVKMALFPNVVSKLVLRLHALWTGEKG